MRTRHPGMDRLDPARLTPPLVVGLGCRRAHLHEIGHNHSTAAVGAILTVRMTLAGR